MTDVLEAMAAEIGLGGDESCPFCKEESSEARKNDFSNNSKKLGDALKDEPEWFVEVPHPMIGDMSVSNRLRTNAHHLIPADESFNPHPRIKQLLDEAHGQITGNVGYNVNDASNGLWLPSYPEDYEQKAITKDQWKTVPITWGQMTRQFPDMQHRITVIAMRHTTRQFHDRHKAYSKFVSKCLDKICEKVQLTADRHECETPVKQMEKPWRPPYSLNNRLNGLSGRLRNLLLGAPKSWRSPVFTSAHAKRYFEAQARVTPRGK